MTTTTLRVTRASDDIMAPCLVCGEPTPHDRREYETMGGGVVIAYKGRPHRERPPGDREGKDSPEWQYRAHKTCPSGIRG